MHGRRGPARKDARTTRTKEIRASVGQWPRTVVTFWSRSGFATITEEPTLHVLDRLDRKDRPAPVSPGTPDISAEADEALRVAHAAYESRFGEPLLLPPAPDSGPEEAFDLLLRTLRERLTARGEQIHAIGG
ncbi:hypothetical protein ACWD4B_15775 [Streptomyces sp. NPDC002536]